MSNIFTAFLFLGGGMGCLKAVECWHEHQWIGWAWLSGALVVTCVGMWRMEKLS